VYTPLLWRRVRGATWFGPNAKIDFKNNIPGIFKRRLELRTKLEAERLIALRSLEHRSNIFSQKYYKLKKCCSRRNEKICEIGGE